MITQEQLSRMKFVGPNPSVVTVKKDQDIKMLLHISKTHVPQNLKTCIKMFDLSCFIFSSPNKRINFVDK